MPVFNSARYLPEAIESVLAQDFPDYEFIIIDDCSSDHSADIAGSYARKDGRIFFKKNERNAGMVENWNRCLREARGEYIKFLFGDDMMPSRSAIGKMAGVLDSDPHVALVASARRLIDKESLVFGALSGYPGGRTYAGAEIIKDCLIEQKNNIGEPSAVMFRREQSRRGFDARYRQIVDLEMWFHLLEQGSFAYIDEHLSAFRIHPGQQTDYNISRCLAINEPFLLIQGYGRKPYLAFYRWERAYMRYVPAYGVWKSYKKHKKISRADAASLIPWRHSFAARVFFQFYLCKPFYKVCRAMQRRRRKQKYGSWE